MAAFLHYSSMRPSGVPRSKVGTNFFCLNRFSRFKCHSVEEVQGYKYEIRAKSDCQSVPEIHVVKVEQIFNMFCVCDHVYFSSYS